MSTQTARDSLVFAAFRLENMGFDVRDIGAGLKALAWLMQASDPAQCEGLSEMPILHGLGQLVELVGDHVSSKGEEVMDAASEIRIQNGPQSQFAVHPGAGA
ncbi:MAG: hypothetical protein RBS40_00270 [Rhodocyclaceae bacterium]|jgi:hypothetical protein|nr:hypothetical protein [Rhodocyclaceae bacterium]